MTDPNYPNQYDPQQQPGQPQYIPGAPVPSAPLPPDKQRNWFVRHKVLTGLGALLLIAVVGSAASKGSGSSPAASSPGSSTGSSTGSSSSGSSAAASRTTSAPTTSAPTASTPGIGTPVRDGKFEFTVTKVRTGIASVGDQYVGETAQGQYVFVYVTVKNIGDQGQTLIDDNQTVVDAAGRQFNPDSTAEIYLKNNDVWINQINPGNSVSGILVYDMPKGAVPASIDLHDSMFSGGVKVSLK